MNMSRYTEIVLENVISRSKNHPGTLKYARKLLPGYERVTVHRTFLKNVLRRRKTPRYSQNRATNYDLRRNRLLGILVSKYNEIVHKNLLSGLKKPQVQSNT